MPCLTPINYRYTPMNFILIPILEILYRLLDLYFWIVLITAAMNLCINYGIINPSQPLVKTVFIFCNRLVQPLLRPIQRVIPPIGTVDLSPFVLLLLVSLIQGIIQNLIAPVVL